MPDPDVPTLWREWAERWQRFQAGYVPQREQQFDLMIDYVCQRHSQAPLSVLDLAAGPGSLAGRLLRRRPDARVVCLDLDPWLLELGRQTIAYADRITWVEADLRDPAWPDRLPPGKFDAVLTATALHWLEDQVVARVYRQIAAILCPDGLFLNGDLMPTGAAAGRRMAAEMWERWQVLETARVGEAWYEFWAAAHREPAFADLLAERDRRLGPRRAQLFMSVESHLAALAAAGLSGAEVWRYHQHAIVLGLARPPVPPRS